MKARIDAHCHYWQLARGDYGWLTEDLAPIHRDFGAAEHDAASADAGIEGRVLVQAAPTVEETEFLLASAAADPKAMGVVGWVDLSARDAEAEIERLADDPLFKGVRPMLQDIADPDWIHRAARPEAIARLIALGLRFDALAKPAQIGAVAEFAKANPDLPIIIDHAAKPDLTQGAPSREWVKAMTALGGLDNVSCKLSGLLTEMDAGDRKTPEDAARVLSPIFALLLEWFGPSRIAWGSDWPVVNLAADYGFWCATTDILLTPLSVAERGAILGGTAFGFYGLEGAR